MARHQEWESDLTEGFSRRGHDTSVLSGLEVGLLWDRARPQDRRTVTTVIRAATLVDSSAIIVDFMDNSDESVEGDVRGVPVQVGTT
jgi:hypothetical protein